jgi:hypothetical protein
MAPIDKVNSWLTSLGPFQLKLDASGVCSIAFDNQLDCTVELVSDDTLLAYINVYQLPPLNASLALLKKALELNFDLLIQKNTTLIYQAVTERIMLTSSRELTELNDSEFQSWLQNMVRLAAITIEQLTQTEALDTLKDKSQHNHLDDINLMKTRV